MIIAIDGPAAAGKGTVALRLARHLGYHHLDTGLLYRAVGWIAAGRRLDLDDAAAVGAVASNLKPADLAHAELRGEAVGELASRVAIHPCVRSALLEFQRSFARRSPGAVLDGRDIGSVVCPDAAVKIFVTASAAVRARRRTDELATRGLPVSYDQILDEILARDERDRNRATSPLRPADDAVLLDTSDLSVDAAFEAAVAIVDEAAIGSMRDFARESGEPEGARL